MYPRDVPRIAFATCSVLPDGIEDEQALAQLVGAEYRVWDDESVDWSAYDRVVIRSTWDYTRRPEDFLAWADSVGPQRLRNTPQLLRFNADKRYLTQLAAPTVPTTLLEPGDALPAFDTEIVVKPNISAGARDTGRFQPDAADEAAELVDAIHKDGRAALVQPYLPGVDEHGERAIVFFGGAVSHVLHKRPVLREPGVAPIAQGAHAPAAIMLEPDLVVPGEATPEQLELANAVHAEITANFGQPLFARVDMVPGPQGKPVLIELEAIEPMLYFSLIPGAAERFAAAIAAT
jgi:glutathione synthase/RimK-type ligase-like ATP-grasp enzyme